MPLFDQVELSPVEVQYLLESCAPFTWTRYGLMALISSYILMNTFLVGISNTPTLYPRFHTYSVICKFNTSYSMHPYNLIISTKSPCIQLSYNSRCSKFHDFKWNENLKHLKESVN